jgi:hypothetical protein
MNNSRANTVETRRGLNICFAKGRQSTTGIEEECTYTRWVLLHTHIHAPERKRESSHILSTTSTALSLRERKDKVFFYSLVRDGNHSINHSDSFSTMKYIYIS